MCVETIASSGTSTSRIVTADLTLLRATAPATTASFAQRAGAREMAHALPSGDMLLSTGSAGSQDGTVVLHGSIGPFPYEIEISVQLEGGVVTVRLEVRKPIELGPYEWKFNLTGLVRDSSNKIVGASGIAPAAGFQVMGLNWWCVLRCGGLSILGVLVKCLPSLAGGPSAYIACVVGQLGGAAAEIAACIAHKCV